MMQFPVCHKCGDVLGLSHGPSTSVEVRFRYPEAKGRESFIGGPMMYHAQCAPIVRGKILSPGHAHILPAPCVRNTRWTMENGIVKWTLRRLTASGESIAASVVIDSENWPVSRLADAYRLRRNRKWLRRVVKEHGGLAA